MNIPVNKYDDLLRKTVLFPFFLIHIDTGLSYFSDDNTSKKFLEYSGKTNLLGSYLTNSITAGYENFSSLSREDRLVYIISNYKTVKDDDHDFSAYEKLFLDVLQYDNVPNNLTGLALISLIKNNRLITLKSIDKVDISKLSDEEKFIVYILYFRYYSFIDINFQKSYSYLLKAELLYNDFAQLYTLKVRTLYFMFIEKRSIDDKIKYRKRIVHMKNYFSSEIDRAVGDSHKYCKNNSGIITFQIAYYLHSYDKKGLILYFKRSNEIKKYRVGQRYAIYLWLGKYFMRHGFYKQAYNYLYNIADGAIREKRLDIDMIKARLFLSIYMHDTLKFNANIQKIEINKGYTRGMFSLSKNGGYVSEEGVFIKNINDNHIILPLIQNKKDIDFFNNIDSNALMNNEKKLYPYVILLYKNT